MPFPWEDRGGKTIFLHFWFFIQISWHNWQETTWKNFLNNDLGLLLPFKKNEIRRRFQ